jgi:hypothetical protein
MRYSKLILIQGEPKKTSWWDNKFLKCLWFLLACVLGFFILIGILIFYVVCGAPYELIKCYLEKKCEKGSDEDEDVDIEFQRQPVQNIPEEKITKKQIAICILLGFAGILLQPFYILFYILYAIMECYRRLPCWVIYAAAY